MKVKFFLATIFILLLSGLDIGLRAQTCPGTGSINYQKWNNISGTSISTLTSNPNSQQPLSKQTSPVYMEKNTKAQQPVVYSLIY